MRFNRKARYDFNDTSRKRAGVLVSQRKAREKLPLFAPLIAEDQPPVDEVMEERAAQWITRHSEQRAARAREWWNSRARLARLPEPDRSAFLRYWNRHRWYPGDPGYLATVLHMFEDGRLVMHQGEVVSLSEMTYIAARDAKIAGMTDADLDHMIQTHISLQFVELGRAERQRRAEQALASDRG